MVLPQRSPPFLSKIGHVLAKPLAIKLNYRNETGEDLTRGESVYSVTSADSFIEHEPTVWEWIDDLIPSWRTLGRYVYNLFPFIHWIGRYNLIWFAGDLVAGVTVGAVVVPQSMAYAKLASLDPQFGLYSSFMGVLIYWFFATSKDITIGPVAVMSTIVGHVVDKVKKTNKTLPGHVVASALAVICGAIIVFIGLIRCGWIVELISLAAISAFMTGSAISIAVGQVPALMGITGFDNRAATYKVIINTLKYLGRTKLDAAMGLSALAMLYIIRSACNFAARKVPNRARTFFFISTLRTAFVILLYTMISWLVNRHHRKTKDNKFKILGVVPRGFKNAAVPTVNKKIIKTFASEIPASVIVLLIEHIAIAKSFGRINNYTIDPSQEMVAIGVTNLLGPFLGAYPATGSFSRTAIKSKAGVRTPFAGVITAIVVLLAIYALTAVFFYIPSSSLAAVIIHAVGDLITPPNVVYQFWRISPFEVVIFFVGVFVTIFTSIENGIYATISLSAAQLLFRVLKAKGSFVGKVKITSVIGDHLVDDNGKTAGQYGSLGSSQGTRNAFLPLTHNDGTNPQIEVEKPYPGIFIYRFAEGYNYPNANHYLDFMVHTIFKETRRTNAGSFPRPGDRPWNDPGPRRGQPLILHEELPILKAIILDFGTVNNVDITSIQHLIDVRNQLDKYAAPAQVDWHFANVHNRWTKRALVAAGFGYPTPRPTQTGTPEPWKPIFSVAHIGGPANTAVQKKTADIEGGIEKEHAITSTVAHDRDSSSSDVGNTLQNSKAYGSGGRIALVQGINRPLFHVDLTSALQSAVANVEAREGEVAALKQSVDLTAVNDPNKKL